MISLLAPEDHQPGHPHLASAGRVSFGWEVKVADPSDQAATALPPGATGEILIRGECLFSGYWRNEEATAAAFTGDGWYRTGDIGRLTDDGYLYILDRARDMVISGGENIFPAEVEAVLARHPGIAEAAVIGRPDPVWGEAVHAVIRPAAGATLSADEVIAFCRDRLAHFKCPKSVEFSGPLPRTTTGKVLKRELRARAATNPAATDPPNKPCPNKRSQPMTPLGLSIASHSGLPPARIGDLAAAAEQAGFCAVFVAEGHGDALALCHPVAAATSRVQVGTAIANAALRPPVLAAKTAAQLDHASNGRFVLGLGTANAIMNGRFGIAPFAPLKMIEEYVAVVRAVLAGDAGGFTGDVFRTGMVPLDSPVVRADLPVYLGALGPRMLALAGRIADGVVLNLMSPAQAGEAAAIVRKAAEEAGRDPSAMQVACVVHLCLSDDAALAAAAAKTVVPRYVLHPAVPPLFGQGPWLEQARALTLAGDRAGAAEQVPQHVADGFVAHGDASACAARVEEYRTAGVDMPVLFPMPVGPAGWDYESVIASFTNTSGSERTQ